MERYAYKKKKTYVLMIPTWIVVHTLYMFTITPNHPLRLSGEKISADLKSALLYILMCIAVFCYAEPLHIAVLMACVIGCFYVFCGVLHGIAMIFIPQKRYWALFVGVNNLFVALVVFYLLLSYYGS